MTDVSDSVCTAGKDWTSHYVALTCSIAVPVCYRILQKFQISFSAVGVRLKIVDTESTLAKSGDDFVKRISKAVTHVVFVFDITHRSPTSYAIGWILSLSRTGIHGIQRKTQRRMKAWGCADSLTIIYRSLCPGAGKLIIRTSSGSS
jgi:hypothetical protein